VGNPWKFHLEWETHGKPIFLVGNPYRIFLSGKPMEMEKHNLLEWETHGNSILLSGKPMETPSY